MESIPCIIHNLSDITELGNWPQAFKFYMIPSLHSISLLNGACHLSPLFSIYSKLETIIILDFCTPHLYILCLVKNAALRCLSFSNENRHKSLPQLSIKEQTRSVTHACRRLFGPSSEYSSQLLWSRGLKSSSSAMASKYWVSFISSWSLSRFAWAFLNGLITRPFCGFITKFLRRSSNIIVFLGL